MADDFTVDGLTMAGREVESVRDMVDDLLPDMNRQRVQADNVDTWVRPDSAQGFEIPARAAREHKQLAALARTPWLGLVVTNVVQAMYVNDVVTDEGPSADLMRVWRDNGMVSHQVSNHFAMMAYGQSFGVVTPATTSGVKSARMRCVSPRRMACRWDDPGADTHPRYALELLSSSGTEKMYRVYTPDSMYLLHDDNGDQTVSGYLEHGLGMTPVSRFANRLDLEGRVTGEVDPFIPTAARINKTSYDRLLAQHFTAWQVRTISGIDLPEDPDPDLERAKTDAAKLKLSQEDMLVSEDPETKFGVLPGASLDTFISAWRSDIEALAATSQTPAHALTGQLVNLNAEALAAARSPLTQKVYERRINAGDAYARMLQQAASFAGLDELAADPMLRVTWQDMEIRSMSQAVDALGKAKQMLEVPARALWSRIPGVERTELLEWERMAEDERDTDPLNQVLRNHETPTNQDQETPSNQGE